MAEETASRTRAELEAELGRLREALERERLARIDLERALEESEARTRSLYDKAPVMLHSIDREGRLLSVSDHWLAVLGYERAEVLGRPSTDFLTPESQRYARETILPDYFRTGVCTDVAYQMLTRSGEVRDVLLSAIAERDAEGRIARSFAVLIDITDHKRIEQEFHRAQKLESLGVLASGVAHDFNNLLVGIFGFLDLALLELPAQTRAQGYVREAKTAASRAAELIAQLLAYAGKGSATKALIDLNALVTGMSDLLRTSASRKIALETDLQADLPTVFGDASQLRQLVLNLVTNAAQAIGEGPGRITIRTRTGCARTQGGASPLCRSATPPLVSLQVEDDGPGLDPGLRDRIFDPFFTTKAGGSGLGLAAVHGIVTSHGGAVWVESEPGAGSTFCLCLPASPAGRSVQHSDAAAQQVWRGAGKVLLADDESVVRRVGERMLEQLGFEVVTVTDGAQALEVLQRQLDEIRCVILDYSMPAMDGAEAFQAIHALKPDLPVVLVTGYVRQNAVEALFQAGLSGCLQKPYSLEDLRATMRSALAPA